MGTHSFYFYILMALLGLGVLQGLFMGLVFMVQRGIRARVNIYYGLLLVAFSLTLLHNIFLLGGLDEYLNWPIYFTLSFPPLLFYFVKLSLYPHYRLRLTDVKHFILPVGQFLFFIYVFVSQPGLERHFLNPFYGALEQLLYLITFFFYLYSANKYIQHKSAHRGRNTDLRRVAYMQMLVYIFWVLFFVHTAFILTDFVSYEFFQVNLRSLKLYVGLGALSFAVLVYWLGIYGAQSLIWGKKIMERDNS